MKLNLTGTYQQGVYKWSEDIRQHITAGRVEVPMRFTVTTFDGECKFSFTDYEPFDVGQEPKDFRITYRGKFPYDLIWPAYRTYLDSAGGLWHKLSWIGEWLSWAQKSHEVIISVHDLSGMVSAHATWPHRRYPFGALEMRTESSLFDADEKTQELLREVFEKAAK